MNSLRKDGKFIIMLLGPALLIYVAVVWYPTFYGFFESLFRWKDMNHKTFVGFRNYINLFQNKPFLNSIGITLKYLVINVPIQIITAFIIAYWLYTGVHGYKVFRFIFFIPVVLLTVAVGISFTYLFSSVFGVFKPIVEIFGGKYFDPLSRGSTALITCILTDWWKWLGIKIILFYAGFQNIPEDVLEAAHIDGASRIQVFFRFIIPLTFETINMVVILLVIGSLKVFDLLYVMTVGGPNGATSVISIFLIDTTFGEQNFGAGSAIAVIMFILSLVITLILRKGFDGIRKKIN
jgi:raffinose/stachyose/melibiose transport system permease protein